MSFAQSNRLFWFCALLWTFGCSQGSGDHVYAESDASIEEAFAASEALVTGDGDEGVPEVTTTSGEFSAAGASDCGRGGLTSPSCPNVNASSSGWPQTPLNGALYSTTGWKSGGQVGPGLAHQWVTFTLNRTSAVGDPDLYVRKNGAVSASAYNCRPWTASNPEYCAFYLESDTDYLTWGIDVYTASPTVTLTVDVRACAAGTVYTGVTSYQSASTGTSYPPPAMTCCACAEGYVETARECCRHIVECTQPSDCDSSSCVDGYCCNKACSGGCERCDLPGNEGLCRTLPASAAGDPSCAPYVCNGTSSSCPTGCASDAACAAGLICTGGECKPKASNGAACAVSKECQSGFCADGVCCDTACDGACERCDFSGSKGMCRLAPAGTLSTSCGHYRCDGKGPSCPSTCKTSASCVQSAFCAAGFCHPKSAMGAACASGEECESGFCVDNTCCESACDGQCQQCDGPASLGSCTMLQGQPKGHRAACANDGSGCGGVCDGVQPSCAYPGEGVACGQTSCTQGVARSAGKCSGEGSCEQSVQSCAPYACGEAGCRSSCQTSADCSHPAECIGGQCVGALPNGATCATNAVCASGFCADGVCCESACGDACASCSLEGSRGLCRPSEGEGCSGGGDAGPEALLVEEDEGCGCRVVGGARSGESRAIVAAFALFALSARRRWGARKG